MKNLTDKKSPQISSLLDRLGQDVFGISRTNAGNQMICISCQQPVKWEEFSDIDKREYNISRLCPKCFHEITS